MRNVLGRRRFAQPFLRLAGEHFAGRVVELDELRLFVGKIEPETLRAGLKRRVSNLLSLRPKPMLNVFGLGGVGKSALVGASSSSTWSCPRSSAYHSRT